MPFRADRVTGSSAGPAGEAVDAFGKVSGGFYRLVDDYAFGRIDRPHPGSTMELLKTGVDLYELSPTRIQHNKRLMLPGTSLGRLHAKTAVIDRSTVFIGSMNLDPRSASKNTELGIIAECPQLAKEVIRVIHISKLQSAYRLRFGQDGQSLEWLTMDDEGDVVLSEEPDVTPFMRLQNMLLALFVPEQQL